MHISLSESLLHKGSFIYHIYLLMDSIYICISKGNGELHSTKEHNYWGKWAGELWDRAGKNNVYKAHAVSEKVVLKS